MGTDETQLLREVQTGDREAFRALVTRLAPAAMALASRVTQNRELAEDAVQEAFLEIWNRADRFDPTRGSLRAWALTFVHHKAVDAVRRERASLRVNERKIDLAPNPDLEPEEAGWRADRRTRVLKAVEELSPVQREAVMLAYFGGLTYRQVAERLEVPEGTAKSRLRDGLLTLRGLLETHGVEWGPE